MARVRITYYDFYDVPRVFTTEWDNRLFLFDGHFEQDLDEYPKTYAVYELPLSLRECVRTVSKETYNELLDAIHRYPLVGRVEVREAGFDESRRETIDSSVFAKLDLE